MHQRAVPDALPFRDDGLRIRVPLDPRQPAHVQQQGDAFSSFHFPSPFLLPDGVQPTNTGETASTPQPTPPGFPASTNRDKQNAAPAEYRFDHADQGSKSEDDNPVWFRGYAWKIWQELLTDVQAKYSVPDRKGEDEHLTMFARNMLAVEECCLAQEKYGDRGSSLVYKKLRLQRKMVGVWQAINNLGNMPVRWFRWANLIFVFIRALFNALFIIYIFVLYRKEVSVNQRKYSDLVRTVYFFEFLVIAGWLMWCLKDLCRFAYLMLYHSQRHSPKSSIQVVKQAIGLMRMLTKISEFSAMSGCKHVLSMLRVVRFYSQIYSDIRHSGSLMFNMATATVEDLKKMRLFQKIEKAADVSGDWIRHAVSGKSNHHVSRSGPLDDVERTMSLAVTGSYHEHRTWWLTVLAHILKVPTVMFSLLMLVTLPFAFLVWCTWPFWGLTALFVKIYQLDFVYTRHILHWGRWEFARFLGFMNQLSVIETSEQSKLDGQLLLLFWGRDAKNNTMESNATFCFQECLVLDAWQRPEGSLLAGLAKLAWLTSEDVNWAFIEDEHDMENKKMNRSSSWG